MVPPSVFGVSDLVYQIWVQATIATRCNETSHDSKNSRIIARRLGRFFAEFASEMNLTASTGKFEVADVNSANCAPRISRKL